MCNDADHSQEMKNMAAPDLARRQFPLTSCQWKFNILITHCGLVVSTVASLQEGVLGLIPIWGRAFLSGVCTFSPCSRGFPLCSLLSSTIKSSRSISSQYPLTEVLAQNLDLVAGCCTVALDGLHVTNKVPLPYVYAMYASHTHNR